MKLIVTLVIISVFSVSANTFSQTLTLSKKSLDLPKFFKIVNGQTGYAFVFNKNILASSPPIDIDVKNVPLETVLATVFAKTSLKYEIKYKTIIVTAKNNGTNSLEEVKDADIKTVKSSSNKSSFQQQKITGYVTDDKGQILPAASVVVVGKTQIKLTSDVNGIFTFNSLATDSAMRVSYVGYKTKTLRIIRGKDKYYFALESNDSKLKDVIITGVFDKPKESYTGAVTVITKEQLKMFGNRNLLKTIGNIDPSFDIQERNNFGSNPNVLPQIEIRGSTTIGDVQSINSTGTRADMNQPLFILDGFEVSLTRVMDMNQTDVESVVILKDASSTSIYGSRGANGVIVITSIKPVPGKLRISYSGGANFEIPDLSSYNLLNSTEKIALEQKAGLYTNSEILLQNSLTTLYNRNLKAAQEGVNTNWAKLPTQTGIGQYHKLDLSGGDNQFRYILNGSYNKIEGAMKGTNRNNFNGNMTIMYLMKNFRFSNNLSVGFNNADIGNYGSYSEYVLMNPYWSPYDSEGNAINTYPSFRNQLQYNPYYNSLLTDFNTSQYTNIRNTTQLDWDISKSLKWVNSIGFTREIGGSDLFQSPSNTSFLTYTDVSTRGRYTKTDRNEQNYQFTSTMSYGKVIGKSNLYLGLSAQAYETKRNQNTVIVTGFINDTQTDISNGTAYSGSRPTTQENTVRTVGSTFTTNYSYDSRYFIDATYRIDGASSFGTNSRFGNFWSAGGGWTASNEKIFKEKLSFINQLRFRYSYGVSGSLNFSPAQALTTYTYDRTATYRNQIGATITGFGNEDLKWQNTIQQNFGIDLSLFSSLVNATFNTYKRNTNNAITQGTLAYSHGFSTYAENIGQVLNTGYDANISVNLLRNYGKNNINWSISAGAYANKNIIGRLSDAMRRLMEQQATQSASDATLPQYEEGQSLDEIFVLISPGVDAATGRVLYQNTDGSITTSSSGVRKVAVGSSQPKFNGRLSSMLRYGSFTANVGFGLRAGGKKLNTTLLSRVENAAVETNLDRRVNELRWASPGDITAFKGLNVTDATFANNRFVFTETTFLLNNINLQYELPVKLIQKLNMQRFSISATMSDVFYMSNIEQERGTQYPYSLKPSFSLSATF